MLRLRRVLIFIKSSSSPSPVSIFNPQVLSSLLRKLTVVIDPSSTQIKFDWSWSSLRVIVRISLQATINPDMIYIRQDEFAFAQPVKYMFQIDHDHPCLEEFFTNFKETLSYTMVFFFTLILPAIIDGVRHLWHDGNLPEEMQKCNSYFFGREFSHFFTLEQTLE